MRKTKTLLVAILAGLTISLVGIPPAFAAAPTITSFAPTCGPVGTSVIITGTAFQDAPSAVSAVTFNSTAATTFTVNSDTQITATVPAGATSGAIAVTDSEGTATSTVSFTVTTAAGPCITSFTPASGNAGTVVTIVGAGFTGATAVTFGGTAATTFTVDTATQITVTVPAAAVTGPIAVTTPAGTATSTTNFTVSGGPTDHDRSVSLTLRGHLIAKGRVTSDFADCESATVKIQRRKGGWKTVANVDANAAGKFRVEIRDRTGRYRALVPAEDLGPNDTCLKAKSPKVRHLH
ncbi:MAG: IPT/TIG domain-containing protein [Actinomycetota bacterium]